MKNKGVFYAISALIGVLAAFQGFLVYFISLNLYLFFLIPRKKFSLRQVTIIYFLFFSFFIRAEVDIEHNKTSYVGNEKTFYLVLEELGKMDGDLLTVTAIDMQSEETLLLKYRIQSEAEKNRLTHYLSPGLIIKVNGKLEEPSISTNENAFNYKRYLEQKHIFWILKPDKLVIIRDKPSAPNVLIMLKKVRTNGIHYLESNFPKETIPLATALLFGSSDFITQNTMDNYRELGIVHLLAISGLHIAIIVSIVYNLLLRVGVTREKSIVILLVCLPIYGILTGASPSVTRSVFMTMLLLLGRRWGKGGQFVAIDVIATTFLLYLFVNPYVLYNVGFQLSFLVTLILLLSAPYILKVTLHPVSLLLTTSFQSMLCSAPILLYFFFEFSIISVLVNLLYIPIFNVILLPYLLFVFVLHLLLGSFIDPLLYPLNEMIIFTNNLTERIAVLPWNTIVLGRPSMLFLLLYGWGLFLFFVQWEKGVKGMKKFFLFLFPFFLFLGQYMLTNLSLDGEVTFLDVGQGDCIFIRLPFGKGNYLIDTGGSLTFEKQPWQERDQAFDVGEDTVVPFLKSKGVTKLDKLILTHGDADHAGSAKAILQEMRVQELVLPDRKEKNELERKLIGMAQSEGIAIRFVHEGDRWKVGENRFYILSPEVNSQSDSNDGSIVIYTELGGLKWLFTGDLEAEGEAKLMKKNPTLSVDVLKVGHHGSKSSSTEDFLERLSPQWAIISVGENNRYQHPHQEVLDRLQKNEIIIYRTDQLGAITYTFRKETGTFSVHNP
ncbi:MAG TPA: DNA internalization-related competence protein ComEC/Rec2 [Bacillus sp. (in: firmicutes)]